MSHATDPSILGDTTPLPSIIHGTSTVAERLFQRNQALRSAKDVIEQLDHDLEALKQLSQENPQAVIMSHDLFDIISLIQQRSHIALQRLL